MISILWQQEAGRAGRDGLKAQCVLLYNPTDIMRVAGLTAGSSAELEWSLDRRKTVPKVLSMVRYCQSSSTCRRITMARYLSNQGNTDFNCNRFCDVCSCTDTQTSDTRAPSKSAPDLPNTAWTPMSADVVTAVLDVMQTAGSRVDDSKGITAKQLLSFPDIRTLLRANILDSYSLNWLLMDLVLRGSIELNIVFSPYSAICYLRKAADYVLNHHIYEQIYLPPSHVDSLCSNHVMNNNATHYESHPLDSRKRLIEAIIHDEDLDDNKTSFKNDNANALDPPLDVDENDEKILFSGDICGQTRNPKIRKCSNIVDLT